MFDFANTTSDHFLFTPNINTLDHMSSEGIRLTIGSQEVVEELEQRETVPGVHRLDLQSGVHVGFIQRQEGLGVLGHQLRPPGESLRERKQEVVS